MSEMVTPRSKFDLANASFEFRARNLKNQEKGRERVTNGSRRKKKGVGSLTISKELRR